MDIIGLTALVVAISTALGGLITALHIRKCHSCCIDSDCRKPTELSEPPTPSNIPIEHTTV
jgi:F0F1-type ATP synthase membrane subunit c/vacuolar-type H+-ATPase subunit K